MRGITFVLLLLLLPSNSWGDTKKSSAIPEGQQPGGLVASPTAIEFQNTAVKTVSAPAFAKVMNTGKTDITIKKVVRSAADFDIVDNCSGPLPAGFDCEIEARFAPAEIGAREGTIKLITSSGAELTVSLRGSAVASPVTLSETYLVFRSVLVSSTGFPFPQTVVLTNLADDVPLTITNIALPPDFRLRPSQKECSNGAVVPPLGSCTLDVLFDPTKPGTLDEQITITASDSASPHVVALRGIANSITLSVRSLKWDTVLIGTAGDSQNIELHNTANVPVEIRDIQVRGDFSQQHTCGKELLAAQSCLMTVRFQPKSIGKQTGSVLIRDSSSTASQTVFLIGMGTDVGISPMQIDFGSEPVDSVAHTQKITVTNHGATGLNLTAFNVSGDFVIPSKTCGTVLASGQSCQLGVGFSPTTTGVRNGSIVIQTDRKNTPLKISLTGTGI